MTPPLLPPGFLTAERIGNGDYFVARFQYLHANHVAALDELNLHLLTGNKKSPTLQLAVKELSR